MTVTDIRLLPTAAWAVVIRLTDLTLISAAAFPISFQTFSQNLWAVDTEMPNNLMLRMVRIYVIIWKLPWKKLFPASKKR